MFRKKMARTKIKIVGHLADPDGIIAHALLRRDHDGRITSKPSFDVEHIFSDYPTILTDLKRLARSRIHGSKIIFADINFNATLERNKRLLRTVREGNSMVWVDHHGGSEQNKEFLESIAFPVIIDRRYCAARLVNDNLVDNSDNYCSLLAHMAQVHDFQIYTDPNMQRAVELQDLITSKSRAKDAQAALERLVIDLARKKVFTRRDFNLSARYTEEVVAFRSEKNQAYGELARTISYHNIGGLNVASAFSEDILYMKEGPRHLREIADKVDMYAVIFKNREGSVLLEGRVQFPANEGVPALCKKLGGGGRGLAGGYILNKPIISHGDYLNARDEVLEHIGSYFSKERGSE